MLYLTVSNSHVLQMYLLDDSSLQFDSVLLEYLWYFIIPLHKRYSVIFGSVNTTNEMFTKSEAIEKKFQLHLNMKES